MINNIESNKSLVSALTTSLLKKITTSQQDVRLHRTDFINGYSARSLDTRIASPFFKDKFPKYANKESAFLTLATREDIKWTKEDGKNLKIRNRKLKESFINIFDQTETFKQSPEEYLVYLFFCLIKLSEKNKNLFYKTAHQQTCGIENLNINIILSMLDRHFQTKKSSRLPVIAIYSIYEVLFDKLDRYKSKNLIPLQVHTSSDKHGFGDIEIYTKGIKPFEIVEIKHNIPIDEYLIFDVIKKISKVDLDRYYILTTFQNSFRTDIEEKKISDIILNIKKEKGIDIIANGVLTTLKYYLRFVDNCTDFLRQYTENLIRDAEISTEIKGFHIEEWNKIRNNLQYMV
ncbi:MAG: DNA methyltransferase [Elusimicrobiota bacterium]|nr:DNA methyltransferase [Elusimicrobiota bacterium]